MEKMPSSKKTSLPSQHIFNAISKRKKKLGNACYCLNYYQKKGFIQVILKDNVPNTYICKFRLVDFKDNFDSLLEKGEKIRHGKINDENYNSAPNYTFWEQRYYYYSLFDEGIKMDYESWWSVTPEIIAEYTAKLAEGSTVIDGFCGSGGNVIQFSKYCKKVFAVDIDQKKLDICRNNCKVYKCPDNISFILSDFLLADKYTKEKIESEYIFLSPPWGGVQYKSSDVYKIKDLMKPSIYDIVRMSLITSKKIMFYLPRTLEIEELFEIVHEISKLNEIFFDIHLLKSANKIKALLIIFGEDIEQKISDEEIKKYIIGEYKNLLTEEDKQMFIDLRHSMGSFKFFKEEYKLRTQLLKLYNNKEDFNLPKEVLDKMYSKITEETSHKIKRLINTSGEDIEKNISDNDLKEYLLNEYKNYSITEEDLKIFFGLKKTIGTPKFLKEEDKVRTHLMDSEIFEEEKENKSLPREVIKIFLESILTEQEKIKLKSLNVIPKKKKSPFKCRAIQNPKPKPKPIHICSDTQPNSLRLSSDISNCSTIASNSFLGIMDSNIVREISFELLP
ncbi:MAG: trimethylguanosine synthase [archaeon]|nr:trimethylguanosine synthase [archaeon]